MASTTLPGSWWVEGMKSEVPQGIKTESEGREMLGEVPWKRQRLKQAWSNGKNVEDEYGGWLSRGGGGRGWVWSGNCRPRARI